MTILKFSQFINEELSIDNSKKILTQIINKLENSESYIGNALLFVNDNRLLITWTWDIEDMVYGYGSQADDVPVNANLTIAIKPIFDPNGFEILSLGVIDIDASILGFLISYELTVRSDEVPELSYKEGNISKFDTVYIGKDLSSNNLWNDLSDYLINLYDESTYQLEPIIQDELNKLSNHTNYRHDFEIFGEYDYDDEDF